MAETNTLSVLHVSGLGPHGQGVPYPGIHFKPDWRELGECSLPSCQQQPSKATIHPPHSHPNPRPRPANTKAARQRDKQEVTPAIPFLSLNPITSLMGWSQKAPILVNGQKVITLINSGTEVSSVNSGFCELKVHPLDMLLKLEGTGRATIPYLRYVAVNLQIPGIRSYNEGLMLLVILTTPYAKKVQVMVGSKLLTGQWE